MFDAMRLADWFAERSATGDAHARGGCLAARRAPAHCSADLVVGRRRDRRFCGDPDDVRGGGGSLHAPSPRTILTLAAVDEDEARSPSAGLHHDSDRAIFPHLLWRDARRPLTVWLGNTVVAYPFARSCVRRVDRIRSAQASGDRRAVSAPATDATGLR